MPWTIAVEVLGRRPPRRRAAAWAFVAEAGPGPFGGGGAPVRTSWRLRGRPAWAARLSTPEAAQEFADRAAAACFAPGRIVQASASPAVLPALEVSGQALDDLEGLLGELLGGGQAEMSPEEAARLQRERAKAKIVAFLREKGEMEKMEGSLWKPS